MADKMIWNLERTASVKVSKVRQFTINKGTWPTKDIPEYWELKAWYNANESFYIGQFTVQSDAEYHLSKIHDFIEGAS